MNPRDGKLFPEMGNCFLTKLGCWGIRRAAVEFDEIDEHQTVGRLATVFGLDKQNRLVGQRGPRSQFGFSIPQRRAYHLYRS